MADSWGYIFPNGSWNGQVGLIISKKADVAITPFFVNALRVDHIDFFEASFKTR